MWCGFEYKTAKVIHYVLKLYANANYPDRAPKLQIFSTNIYSEIIIDLCISVVLTELSKQWKLFAAFSFNLISEIWNRQKWWPLKCSLIFAFSGVKHIIKATFWDNSENFNYNSSGMTMGVGEINYIQECNISRAQ